MKQLLALAFVGLLGLCVTPTSAQITMDDFTDRGLSFDGPVGFWVRTATTGNLGYIIVQDEKGRFRIDLYDDGGRFVANQRCIKDRGDFRRNRDHPMFTLVVSVSGGDGYIRDCDGSYETIARERAIDILLNRMLRNLNLPQPGSQIDSYLVQLKAEIGSPPDKRRR